MARISFLMLPEAGHILPSLKVATRVRALGHEVCCLATAEFGEDFAVRGLPWHEVFQETHDRRQAAVTPSCGRYRTKMEIWLPVAASLGVNMRHLADVRALALRNILIPELLKTRPDVVVCDAYLTATFGDEIVRACPAPVVGLNPNLQFHEGNRLPEYVLCPAAFDLPVHRQASPCRRYCEPSVEEARPDTGAFPWDWIDPRRKLIYCALGTQCAMFPRALAVLQAIVDGVSRAGACQLVVAAGHLAGHEIWRRVPANVLVTGYAPQVTLLRRADAAVIHGGLGSIKECILAQVPMLAVPFKFDQPGNAERLEYHELGLWLWPEDCTAATVAASCERLLESTVIPEKLRDMAEALRQCEADAPAVAAIDRLARSV
jgi:UDP:flavonoid glycosyltransferase YjiC (YdhE family)